MFPGGRPQNIQPGGGQPPMVQYPGMYYSSNTSATAWPVAVPEDEGRDVLAESYERMRREMRSLQGGTPSNAPPPPSMDSSRDNAAIKMLLNNENVSLSSLLEAVMDPSTGSNKGTEDPIMKKTVLDKCEGKIAQLYRHRISGMGTFFPTVPPKGSKAKSSCFLTFHHPRVEFNMKRIKSTWICPEVKVDTGKRKKAAEPVVEETSKPKRDKSPALEAAEEFANKPNPSMSTDLFGSESENPAEPIPGQIPVIGPRVEVLPMIDLTKPPPLMKTYPDPPADPYATTAFELWAEIERARRHKEKVKEWEMLNEKHKERDKEDRKRKKKKHRRSRSGSRSHSRSPSRSRSRRRSRSRHRSRSNSRSRNRHGERRWSRSRRRSRSLSLSPSPPIKRSKSPQFVERGGQSRSPRRSSPRRSSPRRSSPRRRSPPRGRSPPRYRRLSPEPLMSSLVPPTSKYSANPYPGDEWSGNSGWSASSGWPSGASHVPENYSGNQMYPGGIDYYYGNSGPHPPYNMPPNYYGMRPSYHPSGYPVGGPPGCPPMWGPRGPPPYGYRPPPATSSKSARPKPKESKTKDKLPTSRNVVELAKNTTPSKDTVKKSGSVSNVVTPVKNPKIESSEIPTTEVIVSDDEKEEVEQVPKTEDISVVHPPGVSPERELPHISNKISSNKESEFTKPMRTKFRELLKPLEKILDTLKFRQRDCEEFKSLIKGLEIGSCEFDGVYTLVEGILCRVVIDATESSKTCFKIILSPVHVTPILMEIHKSHHDWTINRIKRTLEELFYDSRLFPSWKIGNVIAICKECKSEKKKREEKELVKPKLHEKDEEDNVDKEKSQSRTRSHRRRSESKDRDDRKKSRRGSKDDRDRSEKSDRDKKRELKDVKGDDVKESPSKMEDTCKQTADRAEKGRKIPVRELLKIEFGKKGKVVSKGEVANDVVKGTESDSNLGKVKSAGSEANHSDSVAEKTEKPIRLKSIPTKKLDECPKSVEAPHEKISGTSSIIGGPEPHRKLLVPYAKPEDFKLRVRNAQLMMDDLKTHIQNLEGPAKKSDDPSYLLKAGMLCKRTTNDDGKNEVKIAVTPQSLLKMIQIVHTMAATHAPLEKTISVFNKHFTQILGVQEAVSIVLNNCEECGSS